MAPTSRYLNSASVDEVIEADVIFRTWSGITSAYPAIRPELMRSVEITSHEGLSRYLCACPDLDYFLFDDYPSTVVTATEL
jgi:hypothetical protein